MKQEIRKIFKIMLITMISIVPISVHTGYHSLAAVPKEKKFSETKLNLKYIGWCDDESVLETSLNKNNKLHAFEWDMKDIWNENDPLGGDQYGCHEITWKGKKQTFKKLKLPDELRQKPNDILDTFWGRDDILYVTANSYRKRALMLYSVNKEGKLIKSLNLDKIFKKQKAKSYLNVKAYQLSKTKMAFIAGNYDENPCCIAVMNLTTNKITSRYTTTIRAKKIVESKVYGISPDNNSLVVMDLYTGKILNKVNLVTNKKYAFDVKGDYVYMATEQGIFRIKDNGKKWTKIMDSRYSKYMNKRYNICDLTVKNKNKFYIIFYKFKSGDLPVLASYTKN